MATATAPAQAFGHIHDSHISREQWKIVFISGMGFFTDAYDLFVIGVALKLIASEWHISSWETAVAGATSLLSAAIGSLIFGRVADTMGRKFIYGVEVLVLAAGAIASAFAPGIWWLIVFRFILGIGIGGDYPVSATIASEYSGKNNRGALISMVFAMQAAGLIVGPLLAVIFLKSGLSNDLTWRLLLGLGAIPPLCVFWLRRHLGETPRFQKIQASVKESGTPASLDAVKKYYKDHDLLRWIVGASFSWFLLDFAYYGNTISSQMTIKSFAPGSSELQSVWYTLLIFVVAALPGYLLATWGMDRFGRKTIQWIGFALMTITFAAIAFIPGGEKNLWPFAILFGLNYFFTEFGPNTTTFVYPAEIFPVRIRTTSHGIAATMGKIGASLGAFGFPMLLKAFGLPGPMIAAAVISAIGLLVTVTMLPEPKGQELEAASHDDAFSGDAAAA